MLGTRLRLLELGGLTVWLRLRLEGMLQERSFPSLLEALTPPRATSERVPLSTVEGALRSAERVIDHLRVVPNTCLYRSLARYALLRRTGHPVRFVMGLASRAAEITGHAWVELDGAPMGETLDDDLVITYAYPPT